MSLSALLQSKGESSTWKKWSKRWICAKGQFAEGDDNDLPEVDPSTFIQPEPEDADLRMLNKSLEVLATLFPDVQPEVFRQMLATFDPESRLHAVTHALLEQKAEWVQGRWRVPGKEEQALMPRRAGCVGAVPPEEKFRSQKYRKAVRRVLHDEFRGLSESSIDGVLAEHNFSYTLARPTLLGLSSKSWRFYLSSFFVRKKASVTLTPGSHPLVIYREGDLIPTLRYTESADLNKELYDSLIVPLRDKQKREQEDGDHNLAVHLNDREAELANSLHDCECCFVSTSFEQLSACDDEGHFICFSCLRHAANESLFGQGWARNVDQAKGSLRCMAPMGDDCQGCIPQELVLRALAEEKGGQDIWRKFDERLALEALLKSNVFLARCPFCVYAEVDEVHLLPDHRLWRFKSLRSPSASTLALILLCSGLTILLSPCILISSLSLCLFESTATFTTKVNRNVNLSLARIARRHRGSKFVCRNPLCGRSSCLSCSNEWHDIHVCYEREHLVLRSAVERAMAEAIKRTCPRCNVSFVKSSGCNKLTCVCGYSMCYMCRKEIGKESYKHFCDHFRPLGGACTECDKCDLFKGEDEDAVIRKAAEEAEREWREREGVNKTWTWEKKEEIVQPTGFSFGNMLTWWRNSQSVFSAWEDVLDFFVGRFIE